MTTVISETTLDILAVKYPHVKPLVDRYRLVLALYPEAVHEFDTKLRERGLWRADTLEDDDLVFLRENINILEQEIDVTCRQILAILQAELPESQ